MISTIRRIWALVCKEVLQMKRDPSSIGIGIVLPLIFLLLFGFGMSMDIKNIKLTIVAPQLSDIGAQKLIARFKGDDYFTIFVTDSPLVGAERLGNRKADAVLTLPDQLSRNAWFDAAKIHISVNATQAAIARGYENAVEQVVQQVIATEQEQWIAPLGLINIRARMWFNGANLSRWFLMPGVIVIIMALIGCLLTALQVAKEYEKGTMESLFATPVKPIEILLAKMINNFFLGMCGLALSVVVSCFLFGVPLRGSFVWLFVGSSLFLCSQMALGLVISSAVKNQFQSAELAMGVSFMPSVLLSGFLYEINNMPEAIQWISCILPARYYVEFLQTAFLVGDDFEIYVRNFIPLMLFIVVFLWMAKGCNSKMMKDPSEGGAK